MDVLIKHHIDIWERTVRIDGLATPEMLKEMRREGEPRMPVETAASLLVDHPGLAQWSSLDEGWCCEAVASTVVKHLRSEGLPASLRLKRSDWLALLEVCLGAETGLADIALSRIDHSPWPPFIEAMGRGKGPPSLFTLCARAIAREPATFPGLTAEQAKLVRRRSAGINFDPARISDHDPIPSVPAETRLRHLRLAQLCSSWPHRLLRLSDAPRRVCQRPQTKLGTGAFVWGGALAFCEVLEGRGLGWMEGKKVVELGAGTGLVSLCTALLGAATVVSTDLPASDAASGASLLDLIECNAAEHRRALPSPSTQRWYIAPLVWGDDRQTAEVLALLDGRCDLVLASEVAYDDSCFEVLLSTLAAFCNAGRDGGQPTEVLLSHYPRKQAGGSEPELREFERQAKVAGFVSDVRAYHSQTTGVSYELHSMRLMNASSTE